MAGLLLNPMFLRLQVPAGRCGILYSHLSSALSQSYRMPTGARRCKALLDSVGITQAA